MRAQAGTWAASLIATLGRTSKGRTPEARWTVWAAILTALALSHQVWQHVVQGPAGEVAVRCRLTGAEGNRLVWSIEFRSSYRPARRRDDFESAGVEFESGRILSVTYVPTAREEERAKIDIEFHKSRNRIVFRPQILNDGDQRVLSVVTERSPSVQDSCPWKWVGKIADVSPSVSCETEAVRRNQEPTSEPRPAPQPSQAATRRETGSSNPPSATERDRTSRKFNLCSGSSEFDRKRLIVSNPYESLQSLGAGGVWVPFELTRSGALSPANWASKQKELRSWLEDRKGRPGRLLVFSDSPLGATEDRQQRARELSQALGEYLTSIQSQPVYIGELAALPPRFFGLERNSQRGPIALVLFVDCSPRT